MPCLTRVACRRRFGRTCITMASPLLMTRHMEAWQTPLRALAPTAAAAQEWMQRRVMTRRDSRPGHVRMLRAANQAQWEAMWMR